MKELKVVEIDGPLAMGDHDAVYIEVATSLVYIPRPIVQHTTFVVCENSVLLTALRDATQVAISNDGLSVVLPDNATAGLLVLTVGSVPNTGDFTITWFGDYDWLNTGSMLCDETTIPVVNNDILFANTVNLRPDPDSVIASDMYIQKKGITGVEVMFANNTGTLLSDLIGEAYCRARTTELALQHPQIFFLQRYWEVKRLTDGLLHNAFIHVIDCRGDNSVNDGTALYLWDYDKQKLLKIVEFADQDKIWHWDEVQRGPNNRLVADILPAEEFDSMVALVHEHGHYSKEVIGGLSENEMTNNLIFNGNTLGDGIPVDEEFDNYEWVHVIH